MYKETIISEKLPGTNWAKALTVDVISYIYSTYLETGKLKCNVHIFFGNQQTTIKIFDSEASYTAYMNDPELQVWFTQLAQHRVDHGISINSVEKITVDNTDSDFINYNGRFVALDSAGNEISADQFMKP